MPVSGVLEGDGALWRMCPGDPRLSHNGTTGADAARELRCELESLHKAESLRKEPVMKKVQFVGLDVHAETIAVAVR